MLWPLFLSHEELSVAETEDNWQIIRSGRIGTRANDDIEVI